MNIPIGKKRTLYGYNADFSIDASGHSFFIGRTGTGKSTVLESLFLRNIRLGLGGCFIDPHGVSADAIAEKIPRNRTNDVVWFNPLADSVPGLNPLEGENRDLRLDQFIDILAHFYGSSSWLARSDYISRNLGKAVMDAVPRCTALHIMRAFVDDDFRASLAARVTDEFTRAFFTQYDEKWSAKQRDEAASAPVNKLDILNKPAIRAIIGQPHGLAFRDLIDERKILICRFSKGELGAQVTAVLGAIVTSMILFAALERKMAADSPLFPVFVDEFHNLTRGIAHEHLLSETRKYKIALTIADQTISQLPEGAESGIFGNVTNLVVGRVGATDAERLAKELTLPNPSTLQTLTPRFWYARTLYEPVLLEADPPTKKRGDEQWRPTLIRASLENYSKPRAQVEAALQRQMAGVAWK